MNNKSAVRPVRSRKSVYRLVKGHGYWNLTFAGHDAVLKQEQGLSYVAYLLLNPRPEPIHALDLATRINHLNGKSSVMAEIIDPVTGRMATLDCNARVEERSPALDDALVMRRVIREQHQLEALIEDEDQIDPVKEEALKQLIVLYDHETKNSRKIRDSAQKASDAVGRAIKRLYVRLIKATAADGTPDHTLRSFGEFIRHQILLPSGRGGGHGGIRPSHETGGCFTYEQPPGVIWNP